MERLGFGSRFRHGCNSWWLRNCVTRDEHWLRLGLRSSNFNRQFWENCLLAGHRLPLANGFNFGLNREVLCAKAGGAISTGMAFEHRGGPFSRFRRKRHVRYRRNVALFDHRSDRFQTGFGSCRCHRFGWRDRGGGLFRSKISAPPFPGFPMGNTARRRDGSDALNFIETCRGPPVSRLLKVSGLLAGAAPTSSMRGPVAGAGRRKNEN